MDSSKKYDNPSPEEDANFLSKLCFCWILPLLKKGYQNDLEVKDIYNATKDDLSGPLGDTLERNWIEEVQKTQKNKKAPSLKKVIFKTFLKQYALYGFLTFVNCLVFKMLQPIVLAKYIASFRYPDTSSIYGWSLGFGVIGLALGSVLVAHFTIQGSARVGMRVRIACCSLIYRKLLRLNHTSLGKTASGQLVNLLSNDVLRFDLAASFLNYIWLMPIQTCIAFYIMYSYIDYAAIPTFLALILETVFMQGYLSKLQGVYRAKIAQLTDNRIKLMSEITAGIQVIKMYAWEIPFQKIVELARKYEVDVITKKSYLKGISSALGVIVERAALYIAVVSYVLFGRTITGEVVFAMAQLLNTVQLYMCIFFPMALSSYEEAKVSIRRIENFLLMDENMELEYSDIEEVAKDGAIKVVKGQASWLPNPIVDTLMDINLEIKPGTLCCVVGPVGSGKTSLLQVLLRELPLSAGKLNVTNKVSYASQEPWLFTCNVRQNILFGEAYDKDRYKNVIRVCALERDLKQLPFGDRTQVGERGAALSGGQKARVGLARAVYRDSEVYLLDDPLSAVDPHVAKHLFDECIKGYLAGKTRVVVTHQVQFLKDADLIVVMNNGKIEKTGTFADLSEQELSTLMKEEEQQQQQIHELQVINNETENEEVPTAIKRERLRSISSIISMVNSGPEESEELLEKGLIPTSTYIDYYKSGVSVLYLIIFVLLLIISQVACNASDLWVTYWTDNNSDKVKSDESYSKEMYIYIYTALIMATAILVSARSLIFCKICMNASRKLHNVMFSNVLKTPMRFFETNPSGRILNRFSKDMGAVDEVLPPSTLDTIQVVLVGAGILGMVFIVNPWMIIPAIVLCFLFGYIRAVYLASAQDIKRLEGATKAPVFSHVTASLYGLPSIRAFKAQKLIIGEFDTLQDQHSGTWISFIVSSEALGFYLDIISTVFLALVTFQFLIFTGDNTQNAKIGLVIAHSLILTGMLQHGVRQSAEVSSNMISVERVLQYTRLDEEGPWEALPGDKPPSGWPNKGKIALKHAYLRYAPDSPPVLRDLNLTINPGEKIGVVGRTGAGKSSLIGALFRLAPVDGRIELDGYDTSLVGLKLLRSSISIIPQVPTLFSSTLRYNLDPFSRNQDEELWKALEKVELRQVTTSLEQAVSEGGANYSAGQRQLICLARAIVRNNKVLVMDEATANVDHQTDSLIQKTIRESFDDCTVITVAHRLNTIIDSDRVLVMDEGQVIEFGPPHELLQNPRGHFAKMVAQSGPAMEKTLKSLAKDAFDKNNSVKSNNTDKMDNADDTAIS